MMLRACKSALYATTRGIGVHGLLRQRRRHTLLVLTYHSVLPDGVLCARDDAFRNATSVRAFEGQLRFAQRHYRPVHADDVEAWLAGGAPLPPRALLVTFDDGMVNNAEHAAPVLERLGVPAVFLLATGYVGTRRLLWTDELTWRIERWGATPVPLPGGGLEPVPSSSTGRRMLARDLRARCKRLSNDDLDRYLEIMRAAAPDAEPPPAFSAFRFMSWADARDLARRGFTIGSHSREHRILSRLEPAELRDELAASRARIEREVGVPCRWIAYPNGRDEDVGPRVIAAAAACGYRVGLTTRHGVTAQGDDPMSLRRVTVPMDASRTLFDAVTCGFGGPRLRG